MIKLLPLPKTVEKLVCLEFETVCTDACIFLKGTRNSTSDVTALLLVEVLAVCSNGPKFASSIKVLQHFLLAYFRGRFPRSPAPCHLLDALCKYPADATHIHWHLSNEDLLQSAMHSGIFCESGGGFKLIDLAWNSTNLIELMLECSLQISCREHTVIDTCLMRVVAGNLHSSLFSELLLREPNLCWLNI